MIGQIFALFEIYVADTLIIYSENQKQNVQPWYPARSDISVVTFWP